MAVSSKRGERIYEIDQDTFRDLHMRGYMRSYFKDGSLNVATGIPILIVDYNSYWIDIGLSEEHPFYNLFKELSKNNEELHDTYFNEENRDLLVLRVNGEDINIKTDKHFCKLDMRVKILFKEEILFINESDPKYFNQWKFLLSINRVEFV